jgi:hypothetical protein
MLCQKQVNQEMRSVNNLSTIFIGLVTSGELLGGMAEIANEAANSLLYWPVGRKTVNKIAQTVNKTALTSEACYTGYNSLAFCRQ